MAACNATQEALWLRYILEELGFSVRLPLILYEEDQAAIKLAKNQGMYKRTKHIDYRYHFIRERVNSGDVAMEYIETRNQDADLMSKALEPRLYCYYRDKVVVKRSALGFTL